MGGVEFLQCCARIGGESAEVAFAGPGDDVVEGGAVGRGQGLGGGDGEVGGDAGALPVGSGLGMEWSTLGDGEVEVGVQAGDQGGVGGSGGGFADERDAFEFAECVGEFFAGGGGVGAGEQVDGMLQVARGGDVRGCPALKLGVLAAP